MVPSVQSTSGMPGSFPSATNSAGASPPSQGSKPSFSTKFEVDQSQPTTSLQIRLADGTRSGNIIILMIGSHFLTYKYPLTSFLWEERRPRLSHSTLLSSPLLVELSSSTEKNHIFSSFHCRSLLERQASSPLVQEAVSSEECKNSVLS